jgi:predicted PurR-regulated permease PerM
VLVAVTIGTVSAGFLGALVSIPVAGCIKILIEEYNKKPAQNLAAGERDSQP